MSKIAIISEHFYPYNEDANTACTHSVAKGLSDCGEDVTIFSKSFIETVPTFEEKDGYKIVRFFYEKQTKIDNGFNIKSKNILTDFLIKFLTSVTYKIETKKVQKFYVEQIKKENFDYVLSVSNPFMNHETAKYIKNKLPKIHWIAYYYDPYSFNNIKEFFEKIRRKIHEKSTLKQAEKIIALNGIIDSYKENNFYPFSASAQVLETTLPTLSIKEMPNVTQNQRIKLLYVGKFYEDIRRPDELIKLLAQLNSEEYEAEFYGSCCEYLKNNFKHLPATVKLCGTVGNEQSKKLIEKADIVLNVGNKNTNQTPSKIFEYISYGKPIINFYSNNDDTSLKILQNYPLVFNIKNNSNYDIKSVEKFCKNRTQIEPEKLKEIYKNYLSENVIKKIHKFIKS